MQDAPEEAPVIEPEIEPIIESEVEPADDPVIEPEDAPGDDPATADEPADDADAVEAAELSGLSLEMWDDAAAGVLQADAPDAPASAGADVPTVPDAPVDPGTPAEAGVSPAEAAPEAASGLTAPSVSLSIGKGESVPLGVTPVPQALPAR